VLFTKCYFLDQTKEVEMGGDHASRMGNKKDVYVDLVGTSEGKRPLGRLKRSRRTLLKWIFKNWRLRGMN
jgi:hypothetical protein